MVLVKNAYAEHTPTKKVFSFIINLLKIACLINLQTPKFEELG